MSDEHPQQDENQIIAERRAKLAELRAAVEENVTVGQSAVTLLNGLTARIQELLDAGADSTEIQAVLDEINGDTQALSEAVAANTPQSEAS